VADVLRPCFQQHLDIAGAFDDDIRVRSRLADVSAVNIGRPQAADHLGFAAFGDPVQHVGLVAALHGQQGGQQPDRPGAGDKHLLRAHAARWPIFSMWSQALATTVAGSSSTPRIPSAGSTATRYSGWIR
jgi:hypothetical protein